MLQLKRVELQGFKSFCDRTEMKFNGYGVAAVVGPNGCGKSNISDAISWVLGEQSAKSLRGARMEDVIFAGTRDRKPLGMAQVTVTLVDPNYTIETPVIEQKKAEVVSSETEEKKEVKEETDSAAQDSPEAAAEPSETVTAPPSVEPMKVTPEAKPREITITRRLFRSGDSEYLINGRNARLRDIQDIFMGTGLGPESYAIIEQGRIGQILSTKPADRRGVIEEAAGITRFKTRRRLAEAKLEGAKQNLNRVFDILEEVGRQVNSLKRQAAKAKRYEELRGEYVEQLTLGLSGRFQILDRETTKTALELNLASTEVETLSKQVAEEDTAQGTLRERCFATEAELRQARQRLSELKLEAERTRGRLENQARQVADIDARLIRGEKEAVDIETGLAERQKEFEANAAQSAEFAQQTEQQRAQLNEKSRERDSLQNQLRERERVLEASRQQVIRLMGEASSLRNQLAQAEGYLGSIERDTARLKRDEETAVAEISRLEEAKTALSQRASERQLELELVSTQRKTVEEDLSVRRADIQQTRQLVDQRRTELSRIKARKDSLSEVISHRSYTTESVKKLFTAIDKGQATGLKPLGVFADFVEVDSSHEKAIEEFLHEELEYVVVQNWDEAQNGIELMRKNLDGRATFLIRPNTESALQRGTVAEPPVGNDSGVVARLTDVLKFTNGLSQAPAAILPRLARCFLVSDVVAAQRLAPQFPDVYFLLPDGVCYSGYAVSGGKKTGSGPLALKRELRELSSLENARQQEFDEAELRLTTLETDIATLTDNLERLRTQQQAQEKAAIELDHEGRKLAEENQRANSRLSVARMDLQRLEKERERSAAQQTERQQAVARKETEKLELEKSQEDARVAVQELQQQLSQCTEEHASMRAALASLDERLRNVQSARQRLESQVREMNNRRQNLSTESQRLAVDRQRLLADNIQLDQRSGELTGSITQLDEAVVELTAREVEEKNSLASGDAQLKEHRAALQVAQGRRNQIELELVRKQSDLKHLDETCRTQLDAPIEEVAKRMEVNFDEVALVETEEKVRELHRKIENLGPVNPEALSQFEEESRRYDFLNAQRQDLLDSIRDTEKAIQEIDMESKRRFTEAFEKINANFREMFKTLFNGGLGEMRLTDLENVNDSGIDIVAQPPGKKLQNVLLLSGGERAMTAMALLMAIFKYQPSPFCILDEVDAPLDEPNILRLTKLIQEMSETTQFVVITHSKRTMEAAQAMYGVTMQEPGVSKLVSVKFKETAPRPVAA